MTILGEISSTVKDTKEIIMDSLLPKGLNEDFRKKMLAKARGMSLRELQKFAEHIEEVRKGLREKRLQERNSHA